SSRRRHTKSKRDWSSDVCSYDLTLKKIKYSIMTPPESSVSKYTPDKEALHKALNEFFKELKETEASPKLLNMCRKIIDNYDGWTDMFKALLHEDFKHYR